MLRRPVLALSAVLVGCVALGLLGLGVEKRLAPLSLKIGGTASAQGESLAERHFGDSSSFTILLRGPARALDRQGPGLVAALHRRRDLTAISPWDRGAMARLRPGPRRALILVDYHVPLDQAIRDSLPVLEETLRRRIRPPVVATQSSFAAISQALQDESVKATRRAELLAAPLLVLVLLLVFRSLVAAAVPLALGALTVFAGRGALSLLSSAMAVDSLTLVVVSMLGLALGVDYSLLMVSRFREELGRTGDSREAARLTAAGAGRTVLAAGSTLVVAILAGAIFQPGSLLLSLVLSCGIAAAVSVAVAVIGLPALLALLGERINAGRLGRRPSTRTSRVATTAAAVLRRPAAAAALVALALALVAAPALAFNTGAPGLSELSPSSPARADAETIDRAAGPGWTSPFVVLAESPHGPVTTPARLALLARWQRRIAAEPGVRAVIGPAPIARATAPLRRFGERIASPGADGPARLARLGPALGRAADAVARLRGGLGRAAQGSGLLGAGARRAGAGAGLLASGLERAAGAGERASSGVRRLAGGAKRLAKGQRRVAAGTLSLSLDLRSLLPRVQGGGLARARRLATELAREAASDPSLGPEARQARTLAQVLASTRNEVRRLSGLADRVNSAVNRLVAGGRQLERGTGRLSGAAAGLNGGLDRLAAGSRRLAAALLRLEGGAGALERGLASGYHRSYRLQAGLDRAGARVTATARPLLRGAEALRRSSPHLFDSGYFVLSAIDGGPRPSGRLAAEAVDVEGGGQAARMLVVPRYGLNTPGSRRLDRRLRADARRLGREGNLTTGVTGSPATVDDYGHTTASRLPLVVASVAIVTLLMLTAILRAPLLALIAVALNLGSVGAAIGVMSLVCRIPAGYPLGGHPYVDTIGAAAIFGITFGLSIDYAVFLIARMRESYDRDGDHRAAIAFGLEKTAGVITGAAAIMAAVFVSFATAPIATVSQMGLGLTVAILLDATVVRIVLLPALMLLLGERVWAAPWRRRTREA
ncbi:MAG TPA: MMPL family transporter [Solirubrobacterales bacterium]